MCNKISILTKSFSKVFSEMTFCRQSHSITSALAARVCLCFVIISSAGALTERRDTHGNYNSNHSIISPENYSLTVSTSSLLSIITQSSSSSSSPSSSSVTTNVPPAEIYQLLSPADSDKPLSSKANVREISPIQGSATKTPVRYTGKKSGRVSNSSSRRVTTPSEDRESTSESTQHPLDFHWSLPCPRGCECFSGGETVDCSRADLLEVPALHNTSKRLYLEDNLVNQLSRDSFRSAPNLCLLVLERNELTSVNAESFCDLVSLQELELAGNRLRTFTVDGVSQCVLPSLKELDISLNLLRAIPEKLSIIAPNLEILNVAYNEIETLLFDETFSQMKSLKYLDLSRNKVHVLSVADFLPLSYISVEILNIAECGLTKIEPNALAQLKNLTSLSLSGNPLLSEQLDPVLASFLPNNSLARLDISEIAMPNLTMAHLSSFEKIVILDAAYCDVEYFDPKLFGIFSHNLETLHLEGGRLTKLDNLVALRRLRRLHLQENHLTQLDIHGLETLESLDLSYNQLEALPAHWLHSLPNLQVLNLSHNKIKSIHVEAFDGVGILSTLDLSYNQLESLHSFGLIKLSRLDVSNNQISDINKNAFTNLISSLTELNLSNNKLTSLSEMIASKNENVSLGKWHYNLRILNLASNHLHNFFKIRRPFEVSATLVFAKLTELETLDLSRNGISNLDCDMMHYMPYLAELKMAENNFSNLMDTNVWCTNNLAKLNLAKNRLNVVETKVLSRLVNLANLDLSGNPITCDCRLVPFLKWANDTTTTGMIKVDHYADWASYQCSTPESLEGAYLFSELTMHRSCPLATKQALMSLAYGDMVLPSDVIELAAIVTSVVCVTVVGGVMAFTLIWKRCKIRQRIKIMRYRWQIRYREVADLDNSIDGKCLDNARAEILEET